MKVFKFDPTTGKRGELICERKRISWTAEGLDYMVREGYAEPLDVVIPAPRHDAKHVVHIDAGIDVKGINGPEPHSYVDDEHWLCFCMGDFGSMEDGAFRHDWHWVILPPAGAVTRTAKWEARVAAASADDTHPCDLM